MLYIYILIFSDYYLHYYLLNISIISFHPNSSNDMLLYNKLQVVINTIVIYSRFINNLLYPYNVINTYRIHLCVFCNFELIGPSHELI